MEYVEHALTFEAQRGHVFLASLPVLPEISSCPPATGVVGIFAPFHAVSSEVSSSFPVLARPLLTKFLTISGKAPVSSYIKR